MQSPFGNVCGLNVSGTIHDGDTVKLLLQVKCDAGFNTVNAIPKDGVNTPIAWQGSGKLNYVVPAHNVEISVGYVHSRANHLKIRLAIVVFFNPHGWVRLPDAVLELQGYAYPLTFDIPRDVTEENLVEATKFTGVTTNIEKAYGKRLPEECRETVTKHQRKMQIYPTALDYRRAEEEGGNPLDYAIQRKRLRLEDYVTERPVNSLERQRAIQEEAEQTRARALLDVWELPVRRFLSQLFNKGTRARNIIQRWHNRRALPFDEFITMLLTSKLGLCLTDTALFLFCGGTDSHGELSVPYSWMTTDEQAFCFKLYIHRTSLFLDVTEFNSHHRQQQQQQHQKSPLQQHQQQRQPHLSLQNHEHGQGRYRLRKFLLDATVVQRSVCKRFLVQQFALDCIEYGLSHWSRVHVLIALISAVGKTLVVAKGADEFLLNLKIALEQHNMWSAVNELPVVVKIGVSSDALPVYHIAQEDLIAKNSLGGGGGGQVTPHATPYRLV